MDHGSRMTRAPTVNQISMPPVQANGDGHIQVFSITTPQHLQPSITVPVGLAVPIKACVVRPITNVATPALTTRTPAASAALVDQ